MTKYVLNSGRVSSDLALKKQFHQELWKDLGPEPKIVLCNFAQGREYWGIRFDECVASIREDTPAGVTPSFELAMPDIFVEQCKNADVICMQGGDDHLLQYWMRKYDLSKLFEGKVVATKSASSDMLSTQYWTCDWRQCADGFGILPIKIIPHYLSEYGADDPRGPIDWQSAHDELANYGDTSLPIYALKEAEFIVVEPNKPILEFRREN